MFDEIVGPTTVCRPVPVHFYGVLIMQSASKVFNGIWFCNSAVYNEILICPLSGPTKSCLNSQSEFEWGYLNTMN